MHSRIPVYTAFLVFPDTVFPSHSRIPTYPFYLFFINYLPRFITTHHAHAHAHAHAQRKEPRKASASCTFPVPNHLRLLLSPYRVIPFVVYPHQSSQGEAPTTTLVYYSGILDPSSLSYSYPPRLPQIHHNPPSEATYRIPPTTDEPPHTPQSTPDATKTTAMPFPSPDTTSRLHWTVPFQTLLIPQGYHLTIPNHNYLYRTMLSLKATAPQGYHNLKPQNTCPYNPLPSLSLSQPGTQQGHIYHPISSPRVSRNRQPDKEGQGWHCSVTSALPGVDIHILLHRAARARVVYVPQRR